MNQQIKIKMANLTLAIPDELKKMMENFPEINWSEVARDSIKKISVNSRS